MENLLHGNNKHANKMMTMHTLFLNNNVFYASLPKFIQFKEKIGFFITNKTDHS